MVIIQQEGKNVRVSMYGQSKLIRNINTLKLANTLFNKPFGKKYTPKQMWKMGFKLK